MVEDLKFPRNYIRLDETEEIGTGGGFGFLSNLFYGLSVLFRRTPRPQYEPFDAAPVLLQREHGEIVKARYGIYIYADGYEYVAEGSQPVSGISRTLYHTGTFWRTHGL